MYIYYIYLFKFIYIYIYLFICIYFYIHRHTHTHKRWCLETFPNVFGSKIQASSFQEKLLGSKNQALPDPRPGAVVDPRSFSWNFGSWIQSNCFGSRDFGNAWKCLETQNHNTDSFPNLFHVHTSFDLLLTNQTLSAHRQLSQVP